MRINKYIARTGFCSRRKADQLIQAGRVQVNGDLLTDLSYRVQEGDRVEIDGKLQETEDNKLYYLFNKPAQVLSSHSDPHHDRFIYDYFPLDKQLFSAGRLDFDSEGLMLITNDGDFANRIAHPSYEMEKEYLAVLDRPIDSDSLFRIKAGITYQGATYQVNNASIVDLHEFPVLSKVIEHWPPEHLVSASLVSVSLNEGQKREVRRIFASQGYQVIRLIRIRIGSIYLDEIKPGQYRLLTREEKEALDELTSE